MIFPPAVSGAGAGYQIEKSLRFRAAAAPRLTRTPASAGNRRTWTWKGHVKASQLSGSFVLFQAYQSSQDFCFIRVLSDQLEFFHRSGNGTVDYIVRTQAVFRDPTAHYNVMVSVDTTQATASNRVKIYIDDSLVASLSVASYPPQNFDTWVNQASQHTIGANYTGVFASHFDGYQSEIYFIDGQQLTPASFGESIGGAWTPKAYTGSYGTNGFYLPFDDGTNLTNLCLDRSGNGNNWTATNISLTTGVTYDWSDDTPSNNFCVLNNLYIDPPETVSDGGLTSRSTSAGWAGAGGSIAVSSGKWYFEITPQSGIGGSEETIVGIQNVAFQIPDVGATNAGSYGYRQNGQKGNNNVFSAYGATYTNGDVIGVALDMNSGTVTFYKNGVSQGVAYSGLTGAFTAMVTQSSSPVVAINFGQRPFTYTPPSGHSTLCAANLTNTSVTTSGTFTGNASTEGPFVWLNGVPLAMTINGNAVTFGTHAIRTAGGLKVISSSASYNAAGSNTYSITSTGAAFKNARAQVNP